MKKTVADYIKTIPDFPKPGILFRDVTSVLDNADGFQLSIDEMANLLKDVDYDVIAGVESRGFLFGAPIAYKDHKPFALIRKKGKLPRDTVEESYDLEYGSATIELHKDAIKPGDKVIIVDDLIATGGTVGAAAKLIERLGGEVVKMIFLIELTDLKGRENLKGYAVDSVVQYEGE
jgi:adenine phosphoribosyltransferase